MLDLVGEMPVGHRRPPTPLLQQPRALRLPPSRIPDWSVEVAKEPGLFRRVTGIPLSLFEEMLETMEPVRSCIVVTAPTCCHGFITRNGRQTLWLKYNWLEAIAETVVPPTCEQIAG